MKQIITTAIICIIILVSGSIVYNYFINKRHNKKIETYETALSEANKLIIKRNQKIKELEKIKIKTVKEFIYLKDEEKNKEYEILYNKCLAQEELLKQDMIIIDELYKNFEDCKNNYKKLANRKGITIEPVVLVGIKYKDINDIKVSPGIGITINKTFDLKLFTFGIGGGGYGKIPTNDNVKEFGIIAQFKFGW